MVGHNVPGKQKKAIMKPVESEITSKYSWKRYIKKVNRGDATKEKKT
jgi:hypothetical protein